MRARIPTTFTPPKCGFTPPYGYNFYSSVRTCATIHIHFRVFSGHYSVIGVFSGPFSVIGTTGAFYCQVESRHGTPESRLGLHVLSTSKCFPAKKRKDSDTRRASFTAQGWRPWNRRLLIPGFTSWIHVTDDHDVTPQYAQNSPSLLILLRLVLLCCFISSALP